MLDRRPRLLSNEKQTARSRGDAAAKGVSSSAMFGVLTKPFKVLSRALGAALSEFKRRRRERATYLALSELSDGMLRDVGVDRSEILSLAATLSRQPAGTVRSVQEIRLEEARHLATTAHLKVGHAVPLESRESSSSPNNTHAPRTGGPQEG